MFDRLHLLSDGQTIFFGKTGDAVKYFEEIGWKCPPLWNAADFLLDLIATVGFWIGRVSIEVLDFYIFPLSLLSLGLPIDGSGKGDQGAHRCPLPEKFGKGRPVLMRTTWPACHRFLLFDTATQRLGTYFIFFVVHVCALRFDNHDSYIFFRAYQTEMMCSNIFHVLNLH